MRLQLVRALRPMGDGQAEEARQSRSSRCPGPGLQARAGTLPSARRCRRRPAGRAGSVRAAGPVRGSGQPALVRPFGGVLQDGVHDWSGVGSDGRRMGRDRRSASRRRRRGNAPEAPLPRSAGSPEGRSASCRVSPCKFGLPSSQRACCAQPPRSISSRWKAVSAASSVRPSRSAARRMARSAVSGAAATWAQKPVRPGDFRRQVMRRPFPPGGKGALPRARASTAPGPGRSTPPPTGRSSGR